jgi:hypothetical protein
MIRPTTSEVATLPGCGASGRQAVHFVSSALSSPTFADSGGEIGFIGG